MTKFSDLKLNPKVLKAIEAAGYDTPTPIQAGAIPPALEGRDVLGIAQTGTGKTASFTLPMITMLAKGRARARMPRSLVLAPTRELAAQVAENFDVYAKGTKLTKALLIGGVSFKEQDQLIDRGVDVLIATPGRLLDHFERGKLLLTGVQIMVVDEADRMLDMGFIPDIERIFSLTPFTRQTLFFSATMAPEIERITNTFLSNPVKVEVARAATTSETIQQSVVMVKPSRKDRAAKEKRDVLRALIEQEGDACSNAIVFCNRKVDVDIVAKSLKQHGYNAEPIHGDLEQSKRMAVLSGFREGAIRFLCASDVAARGLDISNVSHVFNFDVPSHAEDYVHRIGRTGRAGRSGKAITICSTQDERNFEDILRLVKMDVPVMENPLAMAKPVEAVAESPVEAKPEAEVSEKPKRTRRRRGGAKTDAAAPEVAQTVEAEAPVVVDNVVALEQPTPEPKPRQPRAPKEAPANHQQREGRGRDNRVVGMGDHLPGFIAMSFEERRTS
ncbi:DEAD/DEAH box helicase [Falsihalocynthiibacter sp. S25ZX9]|uniref:DEAD/DEAH box helicase n=1 Tax=Falsihalocynthiibacter sp. S25ZX9 TaxID=3240870 RepID=UPI0035106787